MSRKEATRRVQLLGHHTGLCHCLDLSANASGQVTVKRCLPGAFHETDLEERTGVGLGFQQQENTVPNQSMGAHHGVHSTVAKVSFSHLSLPPPRFRE